MTALKCLDAPAQAPAPPSAPGQKTATVVGGDVNVYNIAHDDVDTDDGVVGAVIGRLTQGQKVQVVGDLHAEFVVPDRDANQRRRVRVRTPGVPTSPRATSRR